MQRSQLAATLLLHCCVSWVGETWKSTGCGVGLTSSSRLHLPRVQLTGFGLKPDHKSSLPISLFKYLIQRVWNNGSCSRHKSKSNFVPSLGTFSIEWKRYSQPIWTRQYADFVVRLKRKSRSHHLNCSGTQEWKYLQSISRKIRHLYHMSCCWASLNHHRRYSSILPTVEATARRWSA